MNDEVPEIRKRASAIIIKDGKVLLMKRVKPGREYFIFPGGGVEEAESIEDALVREVKEELCLDVIRYHFLFLVKNVRMPSFTTTHVGYQNEYYFLVEGYNGIPEIGGPEKERMNEDNQYHLVWIPIETLGAVPNLFPEGNAEKLMKFLMN